MACGDEVGGGCRACGPGVVESCSGVTIARKEEVKGTMVDGGNLFWSHVLLEGNQVTDNLVGYGLCLIDQVKVFYVVPSFVFIVVLTDVASIVFLRGF